MSLLDTTALDSKRAVRHYLDALIAGEDAAIRGSFTEDASWTVKTDLPLAGPWTRRDAIVDFLGQMGQRFEPDFISGSRSARCSPMATPSSARGGAWAETVVALSWPQVGAHGVPRCAR